MADRWVVGDTPHLQNSFRDGDTLTDPGTVTLTVTDPEGVATSYTHADGELVRASTGEYYRNHLVDQPGKWAYRWTVTGAVADISDGTFTVHAAGTDPLDVLTTDEARPILKVGESDIAQNARLASAVTALSGRLDEMCGPIVAREIEDEEHRRVCSDRLWLRHRPVLEVTLLTEYTQTGTPTVLTADTPTVKPANGYSADQRDQADGLSGRLWRTTSGYPTRFADTVVATYWPGRFADTGLVGAVFKEAAAVILINWWQQVLAQPAVAGDPLDLPAYRFPRFAVPDAAIDMLAGEIQYDPGIA
jgi:hypothetical protein